MKKKLALLLAIVMAFSAMLGGITALASEIEVKRSQIPKADLVDLQFDKSGITNLVTEEPWKNAKVNEYASGTSGPAEEFTHIKDIEFTLGGQKYTAAGFKKDAKTNTVGINMNANKADLTGKLSAGFTIEAAFTQPEGTSSSTAIIGATNGGGFGLFLRADGKLMFEVGDSAGGYKDLIFTDKFNTGDFIHVVLVFDGSALHAYANGMDQGTVAISGFRPGSYYGAIGLGGSTASATNYTNFACNPNAYTAFKMYSKAFSEKQAAISYISYLASLTPVVEEVHGYPEADILDITFDKDGVVSGGDNVLGAPVIKEWSGSGSAKEAVVNVKPVSVTTGGIRYNTYGFTKESNTNILTADLSANKAGLTAALSDGFTIETSFVMPAVNTSKSSAIIGATSGGGLGIFLKTNGKLLFEVGKQSSDYADLELPTVFNEGDYVHLVGVYDGTKLVAYANGVKQGELAMAGFRAGGYHGMFGMGATIASLTNPTNYPANAGCAITSLKLYDKPMTEDDANTAYLLNLAAMETAEITYTDAASIVDLEFGTGTVKDVSPATVVGTPVITNYSSSGTVAATSNYKDVKVNYGGKEYTVSGFAKSAPTHTMMLDFSAVSANYVAALSDGFTLETSFLMPADRGESGATSWASTERKGHAIIGATSGGGYVLGRTRDGRLFWCIKDNSNYKDVYTTNTYNAGEYIHAVAQFDKTNSNIKLYINGELIGTTSINTGISMGSLPKSYIGIGGSLGGATNPTNYACDKSMAMTSFKIYNDVLTENQVTAAYNKNLIKLGAKLDPDKVTADIADISFDKNGIVSSGKKIITEPVVKEYSQSGTVAATSGVGKQAITYNAESRDIYGFKMASNTNQIGVDLSAKKADLETELKKGFSFEASFVMPAIPSDGKNFHYLAGAVKTGGFGICEHTGDLSFVIRDGSAWLYANAPLPEAGTYCHVVGTYDAEAKKISISLNGVKVGEATVANSWNPGSWLGGFGLGGTMDGATNFTTNPAPAGTIITGAKLYNKVLTADEISVSYNKHMYETGLESGAAIGKGLPLTEIISPGSGVTPPEQPEEPTTMGTEILDFVWGKNNLLVPTDYSVGKPEVYEYSGSGARKASFANVKSANVTIDGKTFSVPAFVQSGTSNQIGIDFSKYKTELNEAMTDGFSVEASFVIPEGLDNAERYFIGATNDGGFGIGTKDGSLRFILNDGAWKSITTPLPAAGTYCHVIGTYNDTTKTISFWLNGVKIGETAVAKFRTGGWYGAMGIGGSTSSATNYTKAPMVGNTVYTGLTVYKDALTDKQAFEKYEEEMAKFGFEISTRVYDDDFEPVMRFMVTSDVHISSNGDARCGKVANAIGDAYNIAQTGGNHYDDVDAFVFVGDIADNGRKDQQEWFKAICDAGIDYNESQLIVQTGNHDYYDGNSKSNDPASKEAQFNEVFGFTGTQLSDKAQLISTYRGIYNAHFKVNGYHFISLTPSEYGWHYSADDLNWLDGEIKKAIADKGEDAPVFVFQHVGNTNTVLGTDENAADSGVTEVNKILKNYPQVVDFSGHSHTPVNNPCAVHQKDYTNIATGTLNYTSNVTYEGAKVPSVDKSIYDVAQVEIVEVDKDNNIRVRVYDISQNKFVGEPYIIDSYDPKEFKLNETRFDGARIFFAEDAKVEVTKATQNLVSLKFNVVDKDSFQATAFHVVVEDTEGKVVKDRYVTWCYYDEDFTTVLSTAIGGLTPDTDYKLKVYALNTLYKKQITASSLTSENHLETTFKTMPVSTGEPVADIMDVSLDAATGKVTDISENKMTAVMNGTPVIAYDETIGMNAITFATNSQNVKMDNYSEEADSISYSFTAEAYFKVNEYNCESGSKAPLGSEQSGGFGWDMNADGKVTYSVYTGGYKTASKTQEVGKYYHWVCSYDGEYLTVYVNGNKIARLAATAPITYNSIAAQCFYLGADTTGAGNPERQSRVSIALARLYSLPVSDEQAQGLWEKVKDKQDPEAYPDDSDDPEYMFWENVDDLDSEVSFVSANGKEVHKHENDTTVKTDDFAAGSVGYFTGSHLFNSKCHYITGDMQCKLNFTGTAFRYVVYYRGPAMDNYGNAVDVYIDGQLYTTVDNLNGNNLTSRYVGLEVTGLKDKAHEITFMSHDGNRVIMDCFDVVRGKGTEEDGKPIPEVPFWNIVDANETDYVAYYTPLGEYCNLDYLNTDTQVDATETWQFFNGSHLQNHTGIFGNYVQGAAVQLSFNGTGIKYITQYRGANTADIDIYIDGNKVTTVKGLSAQDDTAKYVIYENDALSAGKHTFMAIAATGGQMPIDYFQIKGDPIKAERKNITLPGTAKEERTDLFNEKSTQDRQFVAFEPTASDGYAAYYMRAKLEANKTYTVSFRAISNKQGMVIMSDLEGQGGITESAVTVTETDKWVNYSMTLTPKTSYTESSDKDTKELGFPLRVYINQKGDAQVFVDDIKVTGPDGKVMISQNFDKAEIAGVNSWYAGRATFIPEGYISESEGEQLGYNEIINGDFESADLMDYWWMRDDWNGGTWKRAGGKGYNGTAGLVATGKGDGSNTYNAGIFYNLCGEGVEDGLVLEAGKTYVLQYKVMRPKNVNAYTYIDINEGQVATAAASENGKWETVKVRFVAPEGRLKIRIVANGLKTGQHVYVDDVELRQVGGDPDGTPMTKYIIDTGKIPHTLDVKSNPTPASDNTKKKTETNDTVEKEEVIVPVADEPETKEIPLAVQIGITTALAVGCAVTAIIFFTKKKKA